MERGREGDRERERLICSVILEKPIMETVLQLDILQHQVKPLIPEIGYTLLSHWSKGSHRLHYQTLQAIGYFPQPNSKALLLRAIPIMSMNSSCHACIESALNY